MPSRSLDDLDPRIRLQAEQFLAQCQAAGINAFVTQTYRSNAEQDQSYAQGRTAPGAIVTNARGGQSPHNCTDTAGNPCARAFDFAIKEPTGALDWNASDAQWKHALAIGVALGLVSGASFRKLKDNPHFEMPNWKATTPQDPALSTGASQPS